MLKLSNEFETSVKALLKADSEAIKALETKEVQGKNLVSVSVDELINLKKQVQVDANSKLSSGEFKTREAYKALKAYNDNKYYLECLEVAKKLLDNKYDFIDYRNTSVSKLKEVVTLKPSKASLKKDFEATLKACKVSKANKQAKEAKEALNDNLKEVVKGLSTEELMQLKKYLNTNVSAKA